MPRPLGRTNSRRNVIAEQPDKPKGNKLGRFNKLSTSERSNLMSKIRSTETRPELKLRHELFVKGIRFRKYFGKERIDIAFPTLRLAVFVDGCFWHSCQIHGYIPKTNSAYWKRKFELNKRRASEKDKRLVDDKWTVIHIWEHSIDEDLENCVKTILNSYYGIMKS